MAETPRYDLELSGCTSEPLMAYLKALGILRLVSEQKDAETRGRWGNGTFRLGSTLDRDALVTFFLEDYQPTPIIVPWSGSDFFGVNWSPARRKHRKTPTSSEVIEAILITDTDRFAAYRRALRDCKAALDRCAIKTKDEMQKQKWAFIQELRSSCEEPRLIEWIDAAAVGTVEKFAALLGSGGGSDGNTHFSDNLMQNLWDMLQDFDNQRPAGRGQVNHSINEISRELVQGALFNSETNHLMVKRTSSLYDSGAVGGPNATQGMERDSISNPWNVILALEGAVSFAGAATRRLATNAANQGAFPFQVSASVTVQDGLAAKERAGTEVWLPLWTRPARSDEVLAIVREGRAQCGLRPARTGVDMARAIASLGVDRGIRAFARYAILKGRVGGENYNTAASLGRLDVVEHTGVDLLREVDSWLERFRRAADDKNAPPRFGSALRRIDSAVFDFCKYGGNGLFQRILVALGQAERELARTPGKVGRSNRNLPPLGGLSGAWIETANDHSPEFLIAQSLVSVHDAEGNIGPLRTNVEPVDGKKRCCMWAEKERSVVWTSVDLATNLANVLARRTMDGARAGCQHLPLAWWCSVPLECVTAFIAGDLDDERIEQLIWALMLVDVQNKSGQSSHRQAVGQDPHDRARASVPLPREYALLKLLFLPRPLVSEPSGQKVKWRLARRLAGGRLEAGMAIRPEPRVLPLLRAARIGEACRIAARRLRVSGLPPMPGPMAIGVARDDVWFERTTDTRYGQRIAAALLIPVSSKSVNDLVHLVCRADDSAAAEAFALSAEGVDT